MSNTIKAANNNRADPRSWLLRDLPLFAGLLPAMLGSFLRFIAVLFWHVMRGEKKLSQQAPGLNHELQTV